jgi:hypothetical protein
MGNISMTAADLDALTGGAEKKIQLDTTLVAAHSAGLLSYDAFHKTCRADTGYTGVSVQIGQELHIRFKNVSGGPISNGTIINAAGADAALEVVSGIPLNITSPAFSSAPIGLYTGDSDLADGEVGVATRFGEVHGIDTDGLSVGGVLYAGDSSGGLSQTFPNYPNRVVIVGTVIDEDLTEGVVLVDIQVFDRGTGSKSYSFTQANVGSGTYFSGGYYDAPAADADLTQASPSVTYGAALSPHSAHAFMVSGGNGTVDTGVVGLKITGASISDAGVLNATDEAVLTADITAGISGTYYETSAKWVGDVDFVFYTVSGSPTTYSLSFNYGLAKYEDLGNLDFTVTGFEVVGTAGAADNLFEMELLHHSSTGWTYSAGAFVPGDGTIATFAGDLAPYDELSAGDEFAWKRTNVNQLVLGSENEGILFKIVASKQNSVTSMDLHISGVIEQLVF